jgi:transposase InsO family protein
MFLRRIRHIKRRKLPKALIIHSDGGKQYSAQAFREVLKKYEFEQSMFSRLLGR